jgi:3-(3-hydroxy-phenyl)propionate hydroxylase
MSGLANDAHYDVAIVGFGPSGAVAAALRQAGVRTLVVDRSRTVRPPRAIALIHEIMRVFPATGAG